jgi:hypothetical protein
MSIKKKKEKIRGKKGRDSKEKKKKDQKMTSLHQFEFVEDTRIFLSFSLKRNYPPFPTPTTTPLHLNYLFHLFSQPCQPPPQVTRHTTSSTSPLARQVLSFLFLHLYLFFFC